MGVGFLREEIQLVANGSGENNFLEFRLPVILRGHQRTVVSVGLSVPMIAADEIDH